MPLEAVVPVGDTDFMEALSSKSVAIVARGGDAALFTESDIDLDGRQQVGNFGRFEEKGRDEFSRSRPSCCF